MDRKRRVLAAVAGIAAVAMAATACGTAQKTAVRINSESSGSKILTLAEGVLATDWSLNGLSPNFVSELDDSVLLPLAIANPPKLGNYIPELATSWKVTPSKVTLHLRKNAKWQNGKPFTATDVIDTFELQGTNGNGMWSQITGVSAPNPHTVVMDVKKGQPAAVLLYDVMGITPLPASQYGKFLVPGLEKDLVTYYQESATNPNAAAKSPQEKAMSSVFKNASGFNPKPFIGDGPYKYVNGTLQAFLVKKWPGFWDAAKIHAQEMEYIQFANASNAYSAYLSGKVDLAQGAMPYNITEQWLHTPDSHYNTADNYAEFALYFNDKKSPWNNVVVRRAIAHLINRNTINQLSMGGHSPYVTTKIPTGLMPQVERAWISEKQIDSLNPYSYDPKETASMLKGVGFTKKKGHWYLPNGKLWTVSIDGPSGWTDSMGDVLAIANEFKAFGIKTTATAAEQPGYWTQQHQGDFDLDWGWGGDGGLNPVAGAAAVIGTNLNYSAVGAYANDPGIGYGPTETVPGLGKVNVPATLAHESAVSGPAQWKTLTWDWARFINSQLPYLALCEKYQQAEWLTRYFTDFPGPKSHLWQLYGYSWTSSILVAQERGMIKPK